MSIVYHTIPPVYDSSSVVLILGSMPSPRSRELGFYYMHPQNRFWTVLSKVFDEELPLTAVERRNFVLRHKIALWDVIDFCEISGAADSSIKNEQPNDLSIILNTADIKAIFVTGKKAESLYVKYFDKNAIVLPSTSPANCAVSLASLIESYSQILKYI